MMKFVALLALLAVARGADKFYFDSAKCNNDWDNSRNWAGAEPSADTPVIVMYASPDGEPVRPVKTLVPADTKALLEEVVLSDDMVIEFGDNVEWTLAEAEGEAPVAEFIGGQDYHIDCDFSCHQNWLLSDGSPAKRPVCDGDIAIFDPDHSAVVFNSKDINVEEVWFGSHAAESRGDIPPWWFSTNNPQVFFDSQECRKNGHINNIGKCICDTSCHESLDDLTNANKERRLRAEAQAEKDLASRNEEIIKPFEVTITHFVDLSACSTCPPWADAVKCVTDSPANVAALESAVRSKLSGFFENYVAVFDSWETNDRELVVKGSFTAPKKTFWVGAPEAAGSSMWWKETPRVTSPPLNNRFLNAMYDAIVTASKACQTTETAAAVEAQKDGCDNSGCGLCTLVEKLQASLADPETVGAKLAGDIEGENLKTYLGFADGVDNATKDDVISSFTMWYDDCIDIPTPDPNATTAENATTPEPIDFVKLADDFVQAKEAQAAGQEALKEVVAPSPRVEAVDITIHPVGGNLPIEDLNFLVDENNKEDLEFALASQLGEEAFFDEVTTVTVGLLSKARRRALVDPDATPKEMSVDVEGTGYGDFSPGSPIYNDIVSLVNDIVSSFDIQTHHKCFDLNAGTDPDCLAEEVKAAVKAALEANPDLTDEEIKLIAQEAAAAVVGCGVQGVDQDTGKCKNPEAAAEILGGDVVSGAITAASADAKNEFDESRATEAPEKSSSIIPIAAGAGAGVLIIIIIIVVVVMKSGGGAAGGAAAGGSSSAKAAASTSDRTVVAFENPMYDDPGSSPAAVYDNGPEAVDDGLYDEPAFSKSEEKANPMYQSNEDIAGMEGEEEGGYLDVAPEDEVGLDE